VDLALVEDLLKKYKRKPLFDHEGLPFKLAISREQVKMIIPQREPVLYVDEISALDLKEGLISGRRYLDPKDPVFSGHFPDFPVYPGSYTIEMIGQLGLCLYYFVHNQTEIIASTAKPVALRATRILGAVFMQPLLPGKDILLLAKKLAYDGFLATAIGQAIVDGKVACVSIGEVAFL